MDELDEWPRHRRCGDGEGQHGFYNMGSTICGERNGLEQQVTWLGDGGTRPWWRLASAANGGGQQ